MTPVRVLIVDDQAPFRAAAAAVIALTEPFVLVGSATTGEQSLSRVRALNPDLVLMDINLPGMDGIEAATLIAALPNPPVVVLVSTYPREEYAGRIEGCGAAAYLDKAELGPDRLLAVWLAVSTGKAASTLTWPSCGPSADPPGDG